MVGHGRLGWSARQMVLKAIVVRFEIDVFAVRNAPRTITLTASLLLRSSSIQFGSLGEANIEYANLRETANVAWHFTEMEITAS